MVRLLGFGSIVQLSDAIRDLVRDGDVVALEGFTHLIPFAAGHEIIRQKRRNLTLVRMTPDVIYDQLIGAGCASKLVFSWGGNPGVGSLHRLRDAVEKDWPVPLEIEEHAHAGMATAYAAGASGLPFGLLRGYLGSDLPKYNPNIKFIDCPFTGERLAARAGDPARRLGHSRAEGRPAGQRAAVGRDRRAEGSGARRRTRAIVTVEEIVDRLEAPAGAERRRAAALGGQRRVRGEGRRVPVVRARLLPAQQRVLQAVGRHRARSRHLHRVDRSARARHEGLRRVQAQPGEEPPQGSAAHGQCLTTTYTADEMMTIAAARMVRNGAALFVGIGLPSAAANLARLTHAPDTVLIYESGTIGTKPNVLPLSIGDGELAETADAVVSVPEMFAYWLQGGRIDLGFLGAAQIDRFANINTTVIGDYASRRRGCPAPAARPRSRRRARKC